MEENKYSFSLSKKLVLGITVLSMITYGTTAFFILVLWDQIKAYMEPVVSYQMFVIATLFLGVLWSVFFGYLAARAITKPLKALEQSVRKAATGDLKEDIEVTKSDDELRALGIAFNQMVRNIRGMVTDINENFEHTNSNVEELNQASNLAAKSSENISRTIDEISQGAERQAVATNTTAESITQINQLSEDMNQKAQLTKQYSHEMDEKIKTSIRVIHDLVKGLQHIAKTNEDSISIVKKLEKNAGEIGSITSLVGDIAEQTNLLAINASIEAARAGDAGRGFAVVASEVRKLADQSGKAVQKIGTIIEQIQLEVTNMVDQITDQVDLVYEERIRGDRTTENLVTVNKAVDQVVLSVDDISQLIEKQVYHIQETMAEAENVAAVAEQTSSGSQEVATAVEQQTAAMQEIAATAQYLKESAYHLKQTISKLKV